MTWHWQTRVKQWISLHWKLFISLFVLHFISVRRWVGVGGVSVVYLKMFFPPWISSGFRQRRREVLWESSGSVETCPHLVESIPCEDPACYVWQVQHEGTCIPTKSSCGPGTAIQNVTCVSIEGTVPDWHKGTVHIKIKNVSEFCQIIQHSEFFLVIHFGLLSAKAYSKEYFWHFVEYASPWNVLLYLNFILL